MHDHSQWYSLGANISYYLATRYLAFGCIISVYFVYTILPLSYSQCRTIIKQEKKTTREIAMIKIAHGHIAVYRWPTTVIYSKIARRLCYNVITNFAMWAGIGAPLDFRYFTTSYSNVLDETTMLRIWDGDDYSSMLNFENEKEKKIIKYFYKLLR